jgi:predicted protein tyrosine phosphatase
MDDEIESGSEVNQAKLKTDRDESMERKYLKWVDIFFRLTYIGQVNNNKSHKTKLGYFEEH